MIAGEERCLFQKRETQMIAGMARRRDGLEREAAERDALAIAEDSVGRIRKIMRGISRRALARNRDEIGRRRAAENPRARRLFQRGGRGAMIAMAVGHENEAHRLIAQRLQKRARWSARSGPGSMIATSPCPTT